MLKLDFMRKCIGGPRRRLRSLTKVWSSKDSFLGVCSFIHMYIQEIFTKSLPFQTQGID